MRHVMVMNFLNQHRGDIVITAGSVPGALERITVVTSILPANVSATVVTRQTMFACVDGSV